MAVGPTGQAVPPGLRGIIKAELVRPMKRTVHAACPHDCPDACAVLITIEDGRATKIQGDPDHPVTRGFLCGKVAKYIDRVYSPDRVLYPMRQRRSRRGRMATASSSASRGTKRSTRLSAVEADQRGVRSGSHPAVLLWRQSALLNGGSMDMRFFHRLGASQLHRSICSETGGVAMISMYGRKMGTEPEQFRHSKYIIAWGANIHGNNIHLWPFIEEARRDGAKLVVIDPYRTRTARAADWHIPINPGTDIALAMGMMHMIVREGWHDTDYIARYAEGFDELEKRLPEYTPERVSQLTGVSKEDIERLAREYATTPAGGDTPELRHTALAERWRGGACGLHVAGDHGIVQRNWRRLAAVDQRRLSAEPRCFAAAGPDVEEPTRPSGAHHQYGGAGQSPDRSERSSGEGADGVQLESRGGLS